MLGDRRGRRLDAHRGEHLVGHPAHRRVTDDGGEADDRYPRLGDGFADPGHGEDGPDGHDGVRRREEDDVGSGDGLQDARRRLGLLGADGHDGLRRDGGAQLHPVLLEVNGPALAVDVDRHMRLDPVVGHRQQPDARFPARTERLGDGAQGIARAEHLRTDDVGGEVAVAEPEPLGADAVRREFLLDVEALVGTAPALLLVDATAEGVHHGVEVGADLEAEQMDVVTGVADHRDVRVGRGLLEATQETSTTDTAGQNHNAHANSLSGGA